MSKRAAKPEPQPPQSTSGCVAGGQGRVGVGGGAGRNDTEPRLQNLTCILALAVRLGVASVMPAITPNSNSV